MPTVNIVANEKILGSDRTFGFDFMHLPPLNNASIVSSYTISVYWYQNKDLGRPPSPTQYGPFMYNWRNGGWERAANGGNFVAAGGKGWVRGGISYYLKPTTNKLGVGISYDDFDKALGTPTTPYLKIDYTLKEIEVTLDKANDTKENEQTNISWSSESTQTQYEFEYTNNGTTKTKTGTTTQSVTFGEYELNPGELSYRLRIYNGYTWSNWVSGKINIIEHPIHLSLEPNKIAQNKDKAIVAMWSTSDTQTQFELIYSGSVSGKITGTTAKTHTFPAGTFSNGVVKLTLRVFNGYVWTEKVAEFMAYGAPPNPTLTTLPSYNTAIPNITWTATEQVSYRVQILKNNFVVLDSSDVYSGNKSHRFTNVLENNTTYTARLRVKNQYEIESEWVSKAFAVAFTELQKPNFDMFANDSLGTIMFNIYNATGQSNFKYCEVMRREYGRSTWDRIATNLPIAASYTDYTCRSGVLYEYKVRTIGTSGGYTDSDIETKQISLKNTMLSDTTNYDNYVVLIHNPKKARAYKNEIHAMQYSGLTKPKFEFGDTRYTSMSVSFKVDRTALEKLEDLYYSNNILMLRDNRGKRLFGYITSDLSVTDADFMKYDVNFNFTETEYNKGVLV